MSPLSAIELHITSPVTAQATSYQATGVVRPAGPSDLQAPLDGASVRIRSLTNGLVEEAFLDANGAFAQEVELEPETVNVLEWTVCDPDGRECARVVTEVVHQVEGQPLTPSRQAEPARREILDPPWPRFAKLVRHCLDVAAELADRTGRDRQELFGHVHAQDRYAEQAFADHNQALYRECWDNLNRYAVYLAQMHQDSLPRPVAPPWRSVEEESREEVDRFRGLLSEVWKLAQSARRIDLESRLAEIARQAAGFSQRLKTEPGTVLHDARRLGVEIDKVRERIEQPDTPAPPGENGLLEGSS